ncbi:Aminodeoxychorismate synthase component 2 [Planctomycetes bacterium Pla163]|uniref:Aminodeoxychorismate synthase component 2 n=1 Tax=Rohdeia mirabilis TaxID=2528008 RepID=A0A518CYR3_9BACT|nr:Aminodeoxychorismate synthase component 2 [Planctomycetes bacterium Pla163]
MILLIDNYDSFTFNLYQALSSAGAEVEVVRNDAESAQALIDHGPTGLVLSPGPGRPTDAGVCLELLALAPANLPVLGVCLGHQCLVEASGGRIVRAAAPVHGCSSSIHHDGIGLLRGLASPFLAARYHSLVAERDSLPSELELAAWTEDGQVMAVRDVARPRFGTQFHPESFLSPRGHVLLERFCEQASVSIQSGGVA